ncbi:adenosylmethionine--8-amino-7-oxononanoate transaminase [Psychrobacter sp. HD31]|uniref:adenosylmethionine--8-amino-7-oxononanoate transaminase n=1 Tax=Psychrobacter sp. HD31 TaxID=3112003 RepID=UPI003DA1F90F
MNQTLFITASDTGVGKTHITANLLKLLLKHHANARAIKPIETGFDYSNIDTLGVPVGSDVHSYSLVNPANVFAPAYYFDVPASPHYSARLAGSEVNIDVLESYCREHIEQAPVTLIEGAGGLLVPFNQLQQQKSHNFTHLIKRLNCPIILVINNQLGAINQALVNIQLCEFHGIDIACVVMNQTDPNSQLALENIAFVQSQTNVPVVQLNKDADFEAFERAFETVLSTRKLGILPSKDCNNDNSDNSWAKAEPTEIDGLAEKLTFDKNHIWHPYTSMTEPLTAYHVSYAEGKHIYIDNEQGANHKLLDAMSSWWAVNLGYNRDELNHTAVRQINQFSHVMFGGLTHDPAVELGKTLIDMMPNSEPDKKLAHVFYTDSGSVSVEVAIKMALQYQQVVSPSKRKILTPMGGYHGDTFGAMSVCDPVNGMHGLFKGMLAEQVFIPRPDCYYDALRKNQPFDPDCLLPVNQALAEHKNEIAGIIIEPIVQGAGGMRFYHPEYLRHLRQICDEHDIVLIFDEIATGFGRTGEMFASTFASKVVGADVTPDIICLGKALTGGFMSFACTIASRRIAEGISQNGNPFMHGPTYMGNPLACAVAKTALDTLQVNGWQTNVKNIEAWLIEGLAPCRDLPDVADVRVLGAIGVVELVKPVDVQKIQAYFISQGVWIRPFGKLVYTMPHFNFNKADIEQICGAIYGAIERGEY